MDELALHLVGTVTAHYEKDAWLRIVNKFKLSPEKLIAQNADKLISSLMVEGRPLDDSQRAALQVYLSHTHTLTSVIVFQFMTAYIVPILSCSPSG